MRVVFFVFLISVTLLAANEQIPQETYASDDISHDYCDFCFLPFNHITHKSSSICCSCFNSISGRESEVNYGCFNKITEDKVHLNLSCCNQGDGQGSSINLGCCDRTSGVGSSITCGCLDSAMGNESQINLACLNRALGTGSQVCCGCFNLARGENANISLCCNANDASGTLMNCGCCLLVAEKASRPNSVYRTDICGLCCICNAPNADAVLCCFANRHERALISNDISVLICGSKKYKTIPESQVMNE